MLESGSKTKSEGFRLFKMETTDGDVVQFTVPESLELSHREELEKLLEELTTTSFCSDALLTKLAGYPFVRGASRQLGYPASQQVPRNAALLIDLFTPPKHREAVRGDVEELYAKRISEYGPGRARIWLYWEVTRSARPFFWRLITLGAWEWIRSRIS